MNQQQMNPTTDQFRDAAKMVPTDCCNSASEKRLADGIRYWDCAKCGATVWIENPIKDHTEQHLDMVSYTPRTDAWYSKYGPLKRGEKHPSLDKVFWGYQKGVPTWVTIERRNELLKRNA